MFSQSDITLIKNLLSVKTDKEIARIIDKPENEVRGKINELTGFVNISDSDDVVQAIYRQREENKKRLAEKKEEREKHRQQKKKEQEEKKQQRQLLIQAKSPISNKTLSSENAFSKKREKRPTAQSIKQGIRNNRRAEPMYETRQVDYSGKKLIRVDTRTFVYINPGDDPEKAREQYLERHNKILDLP